MLNVNDLELRHKKYKRKYYAPLFTLITFVTVITISVASFIIYSSKENIAFENKIVQEPVVVQKIEPAPVIEEKNESTVELADKDNLHVITETVTKEEEKEEETVPEEIHEKTVLSPSLGFISKLESNSQKTPAKESTVTPKPQEKIEPKQTENIEPQIVSKKAEPKIVPIKEEIQEVVINTDKKSSITIARKDEMEDIADVIRRFNINHNPALSLFVAKKYYQLGDYEKAYNYALITNDINNNIEESWLIFSKSLVKLDKREMAIQTLKKYVSHSNSSQARQLLDEIQAGKFK